MTPSLTRAEAAALGRKREQPVKAPGEILAVFVAGKLVNPLNASAWGWQKRSRLAKTWKEAVASAIFEATWREDRTGAQVIAPKIVRMIGHTWNRFDDGDGLQAACKPIRDALIECHVIHSDAYDCGHLFVYEQVIDRARRGVEIRVSLRPGPAEATEGGRG